MKNYSKNLHLCSYKNRFRTAKHHLDNFHTIGNVLRIWFFRLCGNSYENCSLPYTDPIRAFLEYTPYDQNNHLNKPPSDRVTVTVSVHVISSHRTLCTVFNMNGKRLERKCPRNKVFEIFQASRKIN